MLWPSLIGVLAELVLDSPVVRNGSRCRINVYASLRWLGENGLIKPSGR